METGCPEIERHLRVRRQAAALPFWFFGWLSIAAAAGCASPTYDSADEEYYRNDPRRVEEAYREAREDRGKDALLGIDKLLSAALLRGDWGEAERLATTASLYVNVFVAGEQGERDALSFLGREKDKPFKGEPHERVMVDYYLGVLRLANGDPEGALAAFRSAMLKDRGSFLMPVEAAEAREGEANTRRYLFADDYALLELLAAKCYQLLEEPEDAGKLVAEAKSLRPEVPWLFDEAMDPETNVFVLIESGRAPYKVRTGPQGAILGYGRHPEVPVQEVTIDGTKISYALGEDLFVQATTLGGRRVDELNVAKARGQEALQLAGFGLASAGYFLALAGGSRDMQAAGLITMGAGIAAMIFAATAIDPSADTRAWTSLPAQVYLALGRAPPGSLVRLRVVAPGGQSQEWMDVPVRDGLNVYWIRLLPGRPGGKWPGAEPEPAPEPPQAPGVNGEHGGTS
jgi:hypothetical protein